LISKKITPSFVLPQDKLLDLGALKAKAKGIKEYLQTSSKNSSSKEAIHSWDAVF